MKYRDPETGELKDIYVKAADTLPIGTIIDYEGDTVPDGYEEVEDYNIPLKQVFNKITWNAGTSVTTNINVNGSNGGKIYLICYSTHSSTGNETSGYMAMLRCGYNGNNYEITPIVEDYQAALKVSFSINDEGYLVCTNSDSGGASRVSIYELTGSTSSVKKIKKIAQSIGVLGKVLNSKSTSTENTYCCDYINKSTGFIGWTNPNPTSEFAAQTITLSTSDFDEYEIEYLVVIGATSTKSTGRISKNNTAYLDYIGGSGSLKGFFRMVISVNNNNISFNDAICSNDATTNNVRCIPQRVILYKNL